MKYLIFFLLILFPFGQLLRFNLGNSIVLHPNDVAVLVFLLLTLRKVSGSLVRPLVFFAIAVILSLLLNYLNLPAGRHGFKPVEHLAASLYPLRFFAYAGLFFVFKELPVNLKLFTRRWLLIGVVIVAVTGLLQYIFLPNVAFLSAFDWDDHYFRLIGSFLDPGFTGAVLVLGLIMSLRGAQATKQSILFYLALALTYSRASYLMYLVSFAVIAIYRRSLKIFLIATIILAVTIPILPKSTGEGTKLTRENSIIVRINNWKKSVAIWEKNPIFGVGFNTYRYVVGVESQSHSGGADSSILLVLATTGIVGLLAYLYLLKKMWSFGGVVFKVSFLGIIIHSWFNNTIFYPWVMEWLWIALAILSERNESKDLV